MKHIWLASTWVQPRQPTSKPRAISAKLQLLLRPQQIADSSLVMRLTLIERRDRARQNGKPSEKLGATAAEQAIEAARTSCTQRINGVLFPADGRAVNMIALDCLLADDQSRLPAAKRAGLEDLHKKLLAAATIYVRATALRTQPDRAHRTSLADIRRQRLSELRKAISEYAVAKARANGSTEDAQISSARLLAALFPLQGTFIDVAALENVLSDDLHKLMELIAAEQKRVQEQAVALRISASLVLPGKGTCCRCAWMATANSTTPWIKPLAGSSISHRDRALASRISSNKPLMSVRRSNPESTCRALAMSAEPQRISRPRPLKIWRPPSKRWRAIARSSHR